MIGRGFEPVLVYLEEMPQVAAQLGEETLFLVFRTGGKISRSPNGKAILPFLQSIAAAARRLGSTELLSRYIDLMLDLMERTTGSIHGFHTTIPSPNLPDLLERVPFLLNQLSFHGLRNWVEFLALREYPGLRRIFPALHPRPDEDGSDPEHQSCIRHRLAMLSYALLGWSIDHLGDELAIAGFSPNTRHEVRYQHIKGYGEHWDGQAKARLAAIQAGWSTRMGAALRHAAHYLEKRTADKKLMLVLTDVEPADIDADDPRLLIEETHKAVQELDRQGIYTYCINLDPHADDYVRDIFGNQFTVIDRVERLPERLPQLFMALTK